MVFMSLTEDARITSKGQVTIPKPIRDRLGLEAGEDVEFVLTDDGELVVRPKRPAMDRLRDVKASLEAHHEDIDLEALRERSKRDWSGLDAGDLGERA